MNNPKRMQELANSLTPAGILLFLRKWQDYLLAGNDRLKRTHPGAV